MQEKLLLAQEPYYYSIVLIGLLYALYKLGLNKITILFILIFWEGFFAYFGSTIFNIYKIVVPVYTALIFSKNVFYTNQRNDLVVNIFFIGFTVVFWTSYLINGGEILTILSQFFFKYSVVFFLYHGFKDIQVNMHKRNQTIDGLLLIVILQVVFSIAKIFTFGIYEIYVGSVARAGGGLAVVIPILSLIFYWLIKNKGFKRNDWFVVVSFFLIAIASGKRAPVLLFPVIALLLVFYVKGSFRFSTLVKYIPLFLVIFYIGVRLTPSLNPDRQIWGSFDFNYFVEYSLVYNFGAVDFEEIFSESYQSHGRGGSIFVFFDAKRLGLDSTAEFLFGNGLYETAQSKHGRFLGGAGYGVDHVGLMGESVRIVYSLGYLGFLSMFLFSLSLFRSISNNKFASIMIGFYLWEFFLYNNLVVFSNSSALLLVVIIHYSNLVLKPS
jgi:hypothetical protein